MLTFSILRSIALSIQTDPPAQPPASPLGGGWTEMLIMFGGIFLIMYLVLIRPNRKQEQKRLAMLASLQKNDKVVTSGGIHGIVASVKDDEVVLRVDDEKNVRIRFARQAIATIVRDAPTSEPS